MLRSAFIFSTLMVFLFACETAETPKETISEEHAALIGTWQEIDSSDTVIWTFNQYDVKWKGFTHYYEVKGDSLIISGLVHPIVEQTEKEVKFLKLNGKLCTLNRKE